MERPRRLAPAACALALMLSAAAGCKSTRPEVPPPPSFAPTGEANRPVAFGSDPSPATGSPYTAPNSNNIGSGGRNNNPYNANPTAPPAGAPQPGMGPLQTTDAGTPAPAVESLPPMQSIREEGSKPADNGSQPRGTMGRGDSGPAPN